MKRITISIANSFDEDRRMLRTVSALRARGFEMQVVDKKTKINSSNKQKEIPVHHISTWADKSVLFYFEFNIRLFFKLLRTPTDILLSVDSDTLLANTLISVIRQKPLVIDMHELFTEVPELAGQSFKKAIWRRVEKIGIARSKKRYTVSRTIADHYESRYGRSFEVIRNVPLLADQNEQIKKSTQFTIAYVGAINMGRGLEQLIRVLQKIDDVDLMICGKGDLNLELRSLTEELNLTNRVHFSGWIEPKEIQHQLQKAHVGINLLDSTSQSYYLSLANKYFDYIHAGLPIISMNFPEYRYLNETCQTSILIDDLAEEKIIEAILTLKNETNIYFNLLNNCQTAKDQWNWQSESKRLLSIFDL